MNFQYSGKFEIPVMQYFTQWVSMEKSLHEGLKSEDSKQRLQTVQKAAKFFRVSRNLRKEHESGSERLAPLLEILDRIKFTRGDDPSELIEHFKEQVDHVYKIKALSLSTKMLWLKHRTPFVIYDSRARNAVEPCTDKYMDFLTQWRKMYKLHRIEIADTCERLKLTLIHPESQEVLGKEWFQHRVFDIYLWGKGRKRE